MAALVVRNAPDCSSAAPAVDRVGPHGGVGGHRRAPPLQRSPGSRRARAQPPATRARSPVGSGAATATARRTAGAWPIRLDDELAPGAIAVDVDAATVTTAGGVSIDALLRASIPARPVRPGVAGHPLRHRRRGHRQRHPRQEPPRRRHVRLARARPDAAPRRRLDRSTSAPTAGPSCSGRRLAGWASPGVVVRATFSMLPIETSQMTVDTERADDLDHLLELMTSGDDALPLLRGVDRPAGPRLRRSGRSVLTRGDHARVEELAPAARRPPAGLPPRPPRHRAGVGPADAVCSTTPPSPPSTRCGSGPPRAGASARSWRSRGSSTRSTRSARGTACTGGAASCSTSSSSRSARRRRCAASSTRLAERGTPSFLSVLKRFGAANPAPLSFPAPGWTLDPRHPRWRRRSRRAARRARRRRARRRRAALSRQGRRRHTRGHPPRLSRASPSGRRSATPSTRTGRWASDQSRRLLLTDPADGGDVMDNALGDAQTIVLFGGTSDIGRAIVDALVSPATDDGRARRPAARRRRLRSPCASAGSRVDVVPFDATGTPPSTPASSSAWPPTHGDLDVAVVAFGQLGDAAELADDAAAAAALVDVNFTGCGEHLHGCSPSSSAARATGASSSCPASPASGCARRTTCTGRRRPASTASPRGSATPSPAAAPACSSCARLGPLEDDRGDGAGAPGDHRRSGRRWPRCAALRAGRRIVWVPAALRPLMAVARHVPAALWRRVPM